MTIELIAGVPQIQTQGEILDETNAAFAGAFGADFELSDASFTYRQNALLATREAALQSLIASAFTALDIEHGVGRQLDFAGSLLKAPRKSATRSTIAVTLYGAPGKNVGDKRVKYNLTGDLWRTPVGATIEPNGSVAVTLTSEATGLIFAAAQASTAWSIVDVTTGFARLESTADAQRGRLREEDPEYRARLLLTRSASKGTEPAVRAALANTAGVTAFSYDNNRTPNTNANGVPAWHAEAVMTGGTDLACATTVYNYYGATTGYYGNTTVDVTDPTDGTVTPVSFSRVVNYQITGAFTLQLSGDTPLGIDGEARAIAAIANRINTNGQGIDVDPGDLIAAAAMALPPGTIEPDDSSGTVAIKGGTPQATPLVMTLRDNAYTITVPQAAAVTGTEIAPFNLTDGDNLDIAIGDGALVSVLINTADYAAVSAATITELIDAFTAQLPDTVIVGSANGAVVLTSVDTGTDALITISPTSAAGLLTVLGLTAGSYSGTGPDIVVTFTGP
jgi:hypothetical protein